MDKIIAYLKNNWQRVAIIAGVVLIFLSVTSFFLLSTIRNRQFASEPLVNANAPVAVSPASARVYSDLYAVSIDNHIDARPAYGVNQAAFVYEMPVEGDITRFLAFFERGIEVAKIGPVRSARLYLLDWISEYGSALFFHYGGSPEAMNKLASVAALKAVNQDGTGSAGASFWRDESRLAPHNAFTSSQNVGKVFESRLGAASQTSAWPMLDDPGLDARGTDGEKIIVPISTTPGYVPTWIYDRSTNAYTRMVKGITEKDGEGKKITTKNIIVMATEVKVVDSEGRLNITTFGKGKAVVYHDGQTKNATWDVSDPAKPPRFYADDGSEIALTNGNVWIEIVKQ